MRLPAIPSLPAPGILSTAITLYLTAIIWTAVWGVDTFIAGILAGCGSIMIGVWLGIVVTQQQYPTPFTDDPTKDEDESA